MNRIIIIALAAILLASCRQTTSPSSPSETSKTSMTSESSITSVTSDSVTPSPSSSSVAFQTMGKVIASRYADVKFEASLPVLRVLVRNGDRVHQGQLLAELNPYKQNDAIEQYQKETEQARLQMQDVIISQGYDPEQMDRVPHRLTAL